MLPQHLVYKNELNREYVIALARNDETPWWWSEKIETYRSGFKCFKWTLYRCICWLIVEVILWNARCNDEIHKNWALRKCWCLTTKPQGVDKWNETFRSKTAWTFLCPTEPLLDSKGRLCFMELVTKLSEGWVWNSKGDWEEMDVRVNEFRTPTERSYWTY